MHRSTLTDPSFPYQRFKSLLDINHYQTVNIYTSSHAAVRAVHTGPTNGRPDGDGIQGWSILPSPALHHLALQLAAAVG